MKEYDSNIYYSDSKRVDAVLQRNEMIMPNTTENVSCDRLMRVKAAVHHLLMNVIPFLENNDDQCELYLWLNGILSILRIEEIDYLEGISKLNK